MEVRSLLTVAVLLVGCGHDAGYVRGDATVRQARWDTDAPEEGKRAVRAGGSSAVWRIQVLMAQGRYAQAEALIAEAVARNPEAPLCYDLPEEYAFHSREQALAEMKARLGEKSLTLHNRLPTRQGPCPRMRTHYNVRLNGKKRGSIACCPCCVDTASGPIQWEKCRIFWWEL